MGADVGTMGSGAPIRCLAHVSRCSSLSPRGVRGSNVITHVRRRTGTCRNMFLHKLVRQDGCCIGGGREGLCPLTCPQQTVNEDGTCSCGTCHEPESEAMGGICADTPPVSAIAARVLKLAGLLLFLSLMVECVPTFCSLPRPRPPRPHRAFALVTQAAHTWRIQTSVYAPLLAWAHDPSGV